MTTARKPIIVGIDGSESSQKALEWGLDEARRRGLPLRIVHAFVWPLYDLPYGVPADSSRDHGVHEAARALLTTAAENARLRCPDLEVTTHLVVAGAPLAILEEAKDAELVVLGSRGLGGVAGLLIGSVGVHVAAHAPCPVVIIRGLPEASSTGTDAGQVVVGVDGSEVSAHAVEFAFEEASLRGLGLTAVHAWDHPSLEGAGVMLPLIVDFEQAESEELMLLSECLAGWREKYPDVPVVQRLVRKRPTKALIEAADGAELLVVGSRGRGGFAGLLLGSVSLAALNHAHCPVAVVRPVRSVPRHR